MCFVKNSLIHKVVGLFPQFTRIPVFKWRLEQTFIFLLVCQNNKLTNLQFSNHQNFPVYRGFFKQKHFTIFPRFHLHDAGRCHRALRVRLPPALQPVALLRQRLHLRADRLLSPLQRLQVPRVRDHLRVRGEDSVQLHYKNLF